MYTKAELDFAYRYPFSEEAKSIIKEINQKGLEQRHIIIGRARLEEALQNNKIEYIETDYGKVDFVVGYAYARMLVSALRNLGAITKYASAEAGRSVQAMGRDTDQNIERLALELGLKVKRERDGFAMEFAQFLSNMPNEEGFGLPNHRLSNGMVELDKFQLIKVIGASAAKAIAKGLPIKTNDLPKALLEYAKLIKIPAQKVSFVGGHGSIKWIDRLLQTPIPDCRHRTVNLVLAPYLVNYKGLPVEKAVETIFGYITLCKTVNPDTKITEKYIKYQCEYAKSHGMKPLSLARARIELGSGIDFVMLLGEEAEKSVS